MSGDGQILVHFSTISSAADEVRSTAARVQSQLEDLKSGVARIAQSWEGAAQEGYQARQAQWNASADDLQQVLTKIAGALDSAAQNYQSTESKNAGIWS